MTKTEQLLKRAVQIAGGNASAISGRKIDTRAPRLRRAGAERAINEANEVEQRLATYCAAIQAAKEEDPACPDCWIERGQDLAMTHIAGEWPDEHRYGCMECGFEILPRRGHLLSGG